MSGFSSGTYTNTFDVLEDRTVLRKSTTMSKGDLAKEIDFLVHIPERLKSYFPVVLDYSIEEEQVYYDMPLYPWHSLRQSFLSEEVPLPVIEKLLAKMCVFAFEKLFCENKEKLEVPWLEQIHLSRIRRRLQLVADLSQVLRPFIVSNEVVINGEVQKNVLPLLQQLEGNPQIVSAMEPVYTSMVHGDFHFDNFLVNPETMEFILLDPRGEMRGYDWTYDIGKLWTCVEGRYDLLHEGKMSIEAKTGSGSPRIEIGFQGYEAIVARYKLLEAALKPVIKECVREYGDDQLWETRIRFVEALHFCALAPFHLENNDTEDRALARYVSGVRLLNHVVNEMQC